VNGRSGSHPVATAPAGFDAALAELPTAVVSRAEVIDLLPVTHAPERIAEYREAMRSGQRFPPIAVVRLGRRLLLADGHKRLAACAQLGSPTVVVELWTLRRWLRDQGAQMGRKTRQQLTLALRLTFDPAARAPARRLLWDTLGHWRRVVLSAAELLGVRPGGTY
jgi:hypothetical protein